MPGRAGRFLRSPAAARGFVGGCGAAPGQGPACSAGEPLGSGPAPPAKPVGRRREPAAGSARPGDELSPAPRGRGKSGQGTPLRPPLPARPGASRS